MTESGTDACPEIRSRWYTELQFGLLLLLAIGTFFPRITQLSLRGEESRRAQIAVEMIETSDWVVPRLQGELFLSRPPLQNWMIAVVGLIRGEVDLIAVRLPSALAMLFTAVLIYGYARLFLTPTGSLVAGASFCTTAQVMELGWLGETEAVFTFFVSASLLLWHWGDQRQWSPWVKWSVPYVMVACGCLTKGPQAPVYFAGTIGLFLLLSRRWKEAVTLPHFAGIVIFLSFWGSWQAAYLNATGWENSRNLYQRNIKQRFVEGHSDTLQHAISFPLEVFASTLPWSALLLTLLFPGFWKSIGTARSHLSFLIIGVGIAFLSLWFVPGANSRYLMPIYPCLAVMTGLVAQRCWEYRAITFWSRAWRNFEYGMGLFALLIAGFFLYCATQLSADAPLWQPIGPATGVALLGVLIAGTLFRGGRKETTTPAFNTLCIASLLSVTWMIPWVGLMIRHTPETEQEIAKVRELLPEDARLVSLSRVHHLFTFYWEDSIPVVQVTKSPRLVEEGDYFCVGGGDHSVKLNPPFPWKKIGEINCDRRLKDFPDTVVIIGQRLPNSIVADGQRKTERQDDTTGSGSISAHAN